MNPADALAARPQGVLLWRDEASCWFADLGEPAPADAPASRAPVSVLGSMRPDDLMAALADGNDSFAARFLYAWPDPSPLLPARGRAAAFRSGKPHLIEIEGKR